MISPLQVTIMYLIVDTGGSVPAARWSLFNEYFDILKKREKAKGGENQKILERNWAHLSPIHQRAGLILQVDSEVVGGAMSFLSEARFYKMVQEYLRTCEYDDGEINLRARELMSVALDRLVLLSSREEGKISFDVRSLQEFMAAAALTSGRETDVECRLTHIAGLSHWRHVFLIGASRCFAEDGLHHLRASITTIARELDASGAGSYVYQGANLALEMFVDGVGSDHPRSRKLLAQHILDLLALGPQGMDRRLIHVVDEHTIEVVAKKLCEIISNASGDYSISAWKILMLLFNREGEIFKNIVRDNWPVDSKFILDILDNIDEPIPAEFIIDSMRNAVLSISPDVSGIVCSKFLDRISNFKESGVFPDHSPLKKINFVDSKKGISDYVSVFSLGNNSALKFKQKNFHEENFLKDFDGVELSTGWSLISLSAKFSRGPSIDAMINFLMEIKSTELFGAARNLREYIPWPISMVIDSLNDIEGISERISEVRDGQFGDRDSWRMAEARWKKSGVSKDDFLFSRNLAFPTKKIAEVGLPRIYSYQISHDKDDTIFIINNLYELLGDLSGCLIQRNLLELIQFSMLGLDSDVNKFEYLWAEKYLNLLCDSECKISLNMLSLMPDSIWNNLDVVSKISKKHNMYLIYSGNKFSSPLLLIISAYNKFEHCRGLLVLIVLYFGYGQDKRADILRGLNNSAFSRLDDDSFFVRGASILLKLACGEDMCSNAVAKDLCDFSQGSNLGFSLDLVAAFFEIDDFLIGRKEVYISALLREMQSNHREYLPKFRDILKNQLNSRKSTLTKRFTWEKELNLSIDSFDALQEKSDR